MSFMERKYDELRESFLALLTKKENLSSFENYYTSLVSWTKDNAETLGDELLENKLVNVLLELNPHKYIVENPDLYLNMELQRLSGVEFDTINAFVMAIQNTLWDMVIIESDKNCPICIYAGLKYVLLKIKKKIFENWFLNVISAVGQSI